MAAKREQVLWKTVWDVAKLLEDRYGLTPLCSAGVVMMAQMTAGQREKSVAIAKTLSCKESRALIANLLADELKGVSTKMDELSYGTFIQKARDVDAKAEEKRRAKELIAEKAKELKRLYKKRSAMTASGQPEGQEWTKLKREITYLKMELKKLKKQESFIDKPTQVTDLQSLPDLGPSERDLAVIDEASTQSGPVGRKRTHGKKPPKAG